MMEINERLSIDVKMCNLAHLEPLVPLILDGYNSWSVAQAKRYLKTFLQTENDRAGVLALQNRNRYFLGILTYKFIEPKEQSQKLKKYPTSSQFTHSFRLNISSLICAHPLFNDLTIITLFKKLTDICQNNYCDIISVKTKTDYEDTIKLKFGSQVLAETATHFFMSC